MADKVFRNYSFSDIHNHNYILRELLEEQNNLQAKLTNIQQELDHVLGEKTPTEIRIEKILNECNDKGNNSSTGITGG